MQYYFTPFTSYTSWTYAGVYTERSKGISSHVSFSALIKIICMDTGTNQILSTLTFGDKIIIIETVERKSFAFLSSEVNREKPRK